MNTIIESLLERKSVRSFTEQDISYEDKQLILTAAMAAPTAGNQQMYTILDITDQKLKDTLAETCDHQPFIATAKMVLIFCADFQKWYDAFCAADCHPRTPGTGDFLLAVQDAAIAAQNTVTAAQSLGIGSCYIGDIMENYEIHRDLLHLPEYVFPALMLVFGYPTKQQQERRKPERAPMDFIVHENSYRTLSRKDFEKGMGINRGITSYDDWMQAFCKRKYHSDFSLEMTRSVEEALKNFRHQ